MQSINIEEGTPDLVLVRAILLYGNNGSIQHATVHPVGRAEGNMPVISEGELLTRESLQEVVLSLSGANGIKSWSFVDVDVIASGPSMVAWYTPQARRHVHFAKECKLPSGVAMQPAMLWVQTRAGAIYVFALGSDERPGPDTVVYESIHLNVWKSGTLCQGTMLKSQFGDRTGCMEAFWSSKFTHRNDVGSWSQTKHPKKLVGLWRELLSKRGESPFPVQHLNPMHAEGGGHMTVGQLLNKLVRV